MTPLSDALTAAQRRALQALEKAYVAGHLDGSEVAQKLANMGVTDPVETEYLRAALDVLREWGAPVPAEANGAAKKPDPVSAPQLQLIGRLCRDKKLEQPDYAGLTKENASKIIDELQAGTYDPAKWSVPF